MHRSCQSKITIEEDGYITGSTTYHNARISPPASDGLLLLNKAALPRIKDTDIFWKSWLIVTDSSSPVCLAKALPSFFICSTAVACHPPKALCCNRDELDALAATLLPGFVQLSFVGNIESMTRRCSSIMEKCFL